MLWIVHVWQMLDFTAPVSKNDFSLLLHFLGASVPELPQRLFESICGRHQARRAFHFVAPQFLHDACQAWSFVSIVWAQNITVLNLPGTTWRSIHHECKCNYKTRCRSTHHVCIRNEVFFINSFFGTKCSSSLLRGFVSAQDLFL